jgi:hypothetical protein
MTQEPNSKPLEEQNWGCAFFAAIIGFPLGICIISAGIILAVYPFSVAQAWIQGQPIQSDQIVFSAIMIVPAVLCCLLFGPAALLQAWRNLRRAWG